MRALFYILRDLSCEMNNTTQKLAREHRSCESKARMHINDEDTNNAHVARRV